MFGLLDCNNFYVSCERVFQPRYEGRPVVVLSNNDGNLISRSAEAKALGLKMGDPYFQVKDLLQQHNVKVFSSNYALYGDMSRRVMYHLQQVAPAVEIYSIDEAFLDLAGMETYCGNLDAYARKVREGVKARTGIPTCVGIAPTKTLAKLANRIAKKDAGLGGVLYLNTPERRAWALRQVPVGNVWGVGRQYAAKLAAAGVDSAADLARVSEAWARKHLGGVVGARLVQELQGRPCAGLHPSEDGTLSRQSISCSRTFGKPLTAFDDVLAAVAAFLSRAAEKLRAQGDMAHVLTVYISKNRFAPQVLPPFSRSATLTLPIGSTADTTVLLGYARLLVGRLWEKGTAYQKAGVVLDGLEPPGTGQQLDLFAAAPALAKPVEQPALVTQRPGLMASLDALNQRFGRGTVRIATAVPAPGHSATTSGHHPPPWAGKAQWRSPCFTTRLEDLMVVNYSVGVIMAVVLCHCIYLVPRQ
ncbi:DNA-directed DNA polymerase [Hymenobacter roseosalivarius DSM 11622]|uniref:DNA-directed DNA polymerase n=1 Tax=Hymenobacter roseosalivarius DSM 11622 TaxID=645990 RepID=A0A1W1UEA8_9BACT|nr:Y-family DNA polymerase [Hymenobacter roseosalivarius]SMB79438.1 DNA-directed DNA polymerase [Hymenobacter roseosalivarius DSM 11622]